MNSINITGRITHDLELKVTQSNIHVLEFQIAIRDGKDKEGNEKTIFLRCQAWTDGRLLERIRHKGVITCRKRKP